MKKWTRKRCLGAGASVLLVAGALWSISPGFLAWLRFVRWDRVRSPDIRTPDAMAAVEAFIATNGWNSQPDGALFEVGGPIANIRGLPWKRFRRHEYFAATQNGVFYAATAPGWHHDFAGVAFNPHTNRFAPTVRGFKPIGGHWYVWFQPEFQSEVFDQKYE